MRFVSALLVVALSACAGQSARVAPPVPALAVPAASSSTIVLDAGSRGPAVSADMYGANVPTWYDFTSSWVNPSLEQAGIHLVRFPGGSESDAYHWENGGSLCDYQGDISPHATFDNLMTRLSQPLGGEVAVTLNYGSNAACNGGGDPNEAGAWVAYAKQHGYDVTLWTLGNENYGSWEYDLHASKNDPQTYASAFKTGYYPAVKAANARAKLGVVGDFDQSYVTAWNDVVFRDAQPFDFVEIHYYPEYRTDNDKYLLGGAIDDFSHQLAGLRSEMTSDGVPATVPIYLGEYNNDSAQEGKQSVSIVNGLFLGQMLGASIQGGISMATWWLAYGSCDEKGDYSKKLYGWQHFGSEGLFSDGLPDPYEGCSNTPAIPGGTPFPTARVIGLLAKTVPAGSSVRSVKVPGAFGTTVRAYGYAVGRGFAVVAYNNTLSPVNVKIAVRGGAKPSYDGTVYTYGKSQYDKSKNNAWTGATARHLGTIAVKSLRLLLPPYSLTVLTLK